MSLFSSLYTAKSGLQISQKATSVISNNIANAQNENYTRQRLDLSDDIYYNKGNLLLGTGVKADQIVRLHDEFIYKRYRKAGGDLEHKEVLEKILREVAQLFNDVKNVGPQEELNKFFEAWQKLAANPADNSQKIVLAESAIRLSRMLNKINDDMSQTQKRLDDELVSSVDEVNRLGKKIAELTKQIKQEEATHYVRANALRDKRDQLEKALTKLIDPSINKNRLQSMSDVDKNIADYDDNYSISVGGYQLVSGGSFHPIELSKAENSSRAFSNLFFKRRDHSLVEITKQVTGGKIGALLNLRGKYFDEKTGESTDGHIQKFKDMLNSFAKGIMQSVNTIYAGSSTSEMLSNKIGETVTLDVDQQKQILSELYPEKLKNTVRKGKMVFNVYDIEGKIKKEVSVDVDPTSESLKTVTKKIDEAFEREKIDARAYVEQGKIVIKKGGTGRGEETGAVLLKRDETLLADALDMTGHKPLRTVNKVNIPFNIQDGKFRINAYDGAGKLLASREIIIDKTSKDPLYSTLEGIAAQINMQHTDDNKDHNYKNDIDDLLEANFANNKFGIQTKDKNAKVEFNITEDKTGFSGAVGLHKFFEGSGVKDMNLLRDFREHSSKINAYGKAVNGDNEVANKMQQLQYEKINFFDKEGAKRSDSIMGEYRFLAGTIASDTHDIQSKVSASKAIFRTLENQHQSISGVNVDEELIELIKFQAGYNANARVVSTIQHMLDALLGIKV